MDIRELKEVCRQMRMDIVTEIHAAGSGHPGGSLSAVEILAALYFYKMNIDPKDPKKEDRDRFVLSKGHAAPVLYAALAERGYFDKAELINLRKIHHFLQGHPDMKKCPGVEASTGSLGQGISIATGMALGLKHTGNKAEVFTLIGDGEMQEGLVWEAAEAAAHYKLDNLTVILDNNGLQIDGANKDVMDIRNPAEKFDAFGFDVYELGDGNDIEAIMMALDAPHKAGIPKFILCHTVKGKGVSYMENQAAWHGKTLKDDEYEQAMKELEEVQA